MVGALLLICSSFSFPRGTRYGPGSFLRASRRRRRRGFLIGRCFLRRWRFVQHDGDARYFDVLDVERKVQDGIGVQGKRRPSLDGDTAAAPVRCDAGGSGLGRARATASTTTPMTISHVLARIFVFMNESPFPRGYPLFAPRRHLTGRHGRILRGTRAPGNGICGGRADRAILRPGGVFGEPGGLRVPQLRLIRIVFSIRIAVRQGWGPEQSAPGSTARRPGQSGTRFQAQGVTHEAKVL